MHVCMLTACERARKQVRCAALSSMLAWDPLCHPWKRVTGIANIAQKGDHDLKGRNNIYTAGSHSVLPVQSLY